MSQAPNVPSSESQLWDRIQVDPGSAIPLATQVAQQLRWLIVGGSIAPDTKLPPVRQLGEQLGISFHTVRAAYQQLEAEGLVITRQGVGTSVLTPSIGMLARSGRSSTTFTIGVIIPSYTEFYGPLLRGLQAAGKDDPSLIFISDSNEDAKLAEAQFDQLIARGVDGIVPVSFWFHDENKVEYIREYASAFPPVVFADNPTYPPPRVLFDLKDAGFRAAEHMFGHGHRRVGVVTPPREWPNVREMYQGYTRGFEHSGGSIDENLVAEVENFGLEAGYSGAAALLGLEKPPTALLLPGDTLAAGALKAIQERGLKLPEDVALIAFNDSLLFELFDPPITSFVLPAREMGRAAYGLLQQALTGEDVSQSEVVLQGELVIRESCGCEG